jgi:hypothetical protein
MTQLYPAARDYASSKLLFEGYGALRRQVTLNHKVCGHKLTGPLAGKSVE